MGFTVTINGKKENMEGPISVGELLARKSIRPEVVTVEHNDKILDRSKYNETILAESDRIEFVFFMGGGLLRQSTSKTLVWLRRTYD